MKKLIFLLLGFSLTKTINTNLLPAKELQWKNDFLTEKPICIIVPSYNNEKWYKGNLNSIFSQNYTNYRVIYINDCSSDNTSQLVKKYVSDSKQEKRFSLIDNAIRHRALYNLYRSIHSCQDNEIVVILDGDDAFYHTNVLKTINRVYSEGNVWLTHGSYIDLASENKGSWCMAIPEEQIKNNNFRGWQHGPTHPRTFYSWLFKKVKLEDLLDSDGEFYKMTYDVAMMMPMLEIAGHRHAYIDEILYQYNDITELNDHKEDNFRDGTHLQYKLNEIIRKKEKYKPLKD